MKHSSTLWSLPCALLLGLGCRQPETGDADPSGLGTDPEGCRSFATLAGVDVGRAAAATPGELRCAFDEESAEHRCELSAGGERRSSVTEYASVADFVEAGHTLGKLTSLAETRVENGLIWRLSHHYDELGRLVRSVEEAPGHSEATRYADYDSEGRPRRALAERTGENHDCGAWLIDFEYADAARSVARRTRPRDPSRCGFVERSQVERYDGAGNRIGAVAADAAGVTDTFRARHPTATSRVCR